MHADHEQLRIYLAEAKQATELQVERIRLDGYKLAEKEQVQVQMAYELQAAQDAIHAASCRWDNDNQRCTAQLAALKNEHA
eukprot:7563554-Heterocapsa_arctica.AAC.1